MAKLFMGSVHRVACLESYDSLPSVRCNTIANLPSCAKCVGKFSFEIAVVQNLNGSGDSRVSLSSKLCNSRVLRIGSAKNLLRKRVDFIIGKYVYSFNALDG